MEALFAIANQSMYPPEESETDSVPFVYPLTALAEGDEESVRSSSISLKKSNSTHSSDRYSSNSVSIKGLEDSEKKILAATLSPTINEHSRLESFSNSDVTSDSQFGLINYQNLEVMQGSGKGTITADGSLKTKKVRNGSLDLSTGTHVRKKSVDKSFNKVFGGSGKKRFGSDKSTMMNTIHTMSSATELSVSQFSYTGSSGTSKYNNTYTIGSTNIDNCGIDYKYIFSTIEPNQLEKLLTYDSKWLIILMTGMENVPLSFSVYDHVYILIKPVNFYQKWIGKSL